MSELRLKFERHPPKNGHISQTHQVIVIRTYHRQKNHVILSLSIYIYIYEGLWSYLTEKHYFILNIYKKHYMSS